MLRFSQLLPFNGDFEMQTSKVAWAGLPVFMAILMMGCGGDQKHAQSPDPDTSKEVKEAGEAAGTDVKESAEDVKEGTENAAEKTKEKIKDPDGDGH
jgi:hypothetical protein